MGCPTATVRSPERRDFRGELDQRLLQSRRPLHLGRYDQGDVRLQVDVCGCRRLGVRMLAELAGYRSIAVTQKYIDVNDEMKRAAVELVG